MSRQEKLKEIGSMKLQSYASKLIIPCPHKFYENSYPQIKKTLSCLGWKINNESEGRCFGAFNIKPYIYENVIPHINGDWKSVFENNKSVILSKNNLNYKCTLEKYNFKINDIDLWIFEDHISFFALNIELDFENLEIDDISSFHNKIRQFKFLDLHLDESKKNISFVSSGYDETFSFIDFLLQLTQDDSKKSFLNIEKEDCNTLRKENKINNLFSIYNATTNGKLLIGMQSIDTKYSDGSDIEDYDDKNINFYSTKELGLISEIPFYLASCSSMNPQKNSTHKDDYIYACAENGGFGVWKYSSGLTLHDSIAFFGLADDGGPIINNVNTSFYFIYMLNLYINFQIKYIEHEIIDSDFESLQINYWYKKLQKLKNQFFADDIALKFQENEIHSTIARALKNQQLIDEVTNNLTTTKELTQSNFQLYLTALGLIFIYLFEESIKEFATSNASGIILFLIPALMLLYVKRKTIRKKLKM